MEKLFAIIGILLIVGLVYGFSKNKKDVNWKSVGLAFVMQFIIAGVLILTPAWKLVEWTGQGVTWIIGKAMEGISFVFGGLTAEWTLLLHGLLPIIFISALVGLAFHFGILQKFIKGVGLVIAKVFKVDTIVAVNAVTNMFLGQSDALVVTKSYLPKAKDSVIFATLVSGMTSISVSVMGLYQSMGAQIEWIIVSLPITVFSTFVLTQIFMPTKYEGEELEVEADKGENFIDTMMGYAMAGFQAVGGIVVALIVFISLVALLNGLLGVLPFDLTLEKILGVVFYPLALLMGVDFEQVNLVSQILATKFALNEAVAFGLPQFNELAENTKAMVTIALCGFGGIGSIGILIGGFMGLAPNKVKTVAKYGVQALLIATLVNILSGAIIGLFL